MTKLQLKRGKAEPVKVPLLFADVPIEHDATGKVVRTERQVVAFAMVRPASALEVKEVHAEAAFIARNIAEGAAAAADLAAMIGEELAGDVFSKFGADAAGKQLGLVMLAERCTESWEGVVDESGPAELSRGALAVLLRDAVLADRFESALAAPLHAELAEKNALPPLPNGGGGAAQASAPAAATTASPAPSADAAPAGSAAPN